MRLKGGKLAEKGAMISESNDHKCHSKGFPQPLKWPPPLNQGKPHPALWIRGGGREAAPSRDCTLERWRVCWPRERNQSADPWAKRPAWPVRTRIQAEWVDRVMLDRRQNRASQIQSFRSGVSSAKCQRPLFNKPLLSYQGYFQQYLT